MTPDQKTKLKKSFIYGFTLVTYTLFALLLIIIISYAFQGSMNGGSLIGLNPNPIVMNLAPVIIFAGFYYIYS